MAPLLQMRQIDKRFPGVHALRGVDLTVDAGEIVALLGANGAGKSTLMKCLGGVHEPSSGSIWWQGQQVAIKSVREATEYGIAFIHQELNVFDNLDVAANVFLGREPLSGGPLRLVNRRQMREETQKLLTRLGLAVSPDTPLVRLSVAQQQMVEIAKALSQKARLLIMDEPTSSLTAAETARLLEVTKDLRQQGVGVIYVSHRLSEVEAIADRAVVLRDGANVGELARADINHENMVNLMTGRDIVTVYEPPTAPITPEYFVVKQLSTERYPSRQISLAVGRGEILGLAGLVGAGRSEMARAIFGIDRAPQMSLRLDGRKVTIRNPPDAIRQGIYLVPEDRRLAGVITEMPIYENFTLPNLQHYARLGALDVAREKRSAEEHCAQLKVKTPSVNATAGSLSGGNQQKVVLAKWFALQPKVLIFDEPTRGVDVGAKAEIYALMRAWAARGVAIIMISSDLEEVLQLSDRVAVMHEGALTGTLERAECTEENIMRLSFGPQKAGNTANGHNFYNR